MYCLGTNAVHSRIGSDGFLVLSERDEFRRSDKVFDKQSYFEIVSKLSERFIEMWINFIDTVYTFPTYLCTTPREI